MEGIKNFDSLKRLESFILFIIIRTYNLPVMQINIKNLLRTFKPIPEPKKEIFKRPDLVYYMLTGDCDDWTTLIHYIAYKRDIPVKHIYRLKGNAVIHIYPVLQIDNTWFTVDPWQSKEFKPFKIRSDEIEVNTCLKVGTQCKEF